MDKDNKSKKTPYGVKYMKWKYSFSASWTNTISCSVVNRNIALDFHKVCKPIETKEWFTCWRLVKKLLALSHFV